MWNTFIGKTIGRRIGAGYALILVLTLAIGTIAFASLQSLQETSHWVTHTHKVLGQINNIESGLDAAETTQRGYLLTGDQASVTQYEAALASVDEALAETRQLTSNIPAQQERMDRLEPLIQERAAELQTALTVRRDQGLDAAIAQILNHEDVVIHEINRILVDMVETENTLLAERSQSAAGATQAAIFSIAAVILATVLLVLTIWWFTRRSIVRPVRKLLHASTHIADGDLSAKATLQTEDEIGQLGHAFNRMADAIRSAFAVVEREKAGIQTKVDEAVRESEAQQHYLSASVAAMLDAMQRFSDGDLTVKLDPPRQDDAISQLYAGFNQATDNIHSLVHQIGDVVQRTASASLQISSAAEELASGTQEQSNQSTEVSRAVEDMAGSIAENAAYADKTATVVIESGEIARAGSHVVKQTVDKMQLIAEVVGRSAETVNALNTSSEQIGQIVSVIDDIADQTNLLALNAAIEAARAGEQGRGFAVVADEVRKLAERTTKATEEIAQMINAMQAKAGDAVHAIEAGTAEVEAGMTLADQAGASLSQIVKEVGGTVDLISQIAEASKAQSAASEQIAHNVESISVVTDQTARSVAEIARSSEDLSGLMQDVGTLVARFTVRREASRPATAPAAHGPRLYALAS
ncbi:MAG: methyl-accepting chemotaxis protein [Bacteroidota bacterium]